MKSIFLISASALFFTANTIYGQDILQSQVPSVIVNSFQQKFPKASDVEWELEGVNYKAEFEIGMFGPDHSSWFDKNGKLIRHKEEISKNNLPQNILSKLKADYSTYRIDDVKKIAEGNKTTYTLELKSFTEEWKLIFDSQGNILNKIAD